MDFDLNVLNALLETALLALVAVLAFGLRGLISLGFKVLERKMGESNFLMLKEFAVTMASSLEQNPAFADYAGEKKKELAIVAITQWCKDLGIPVDVELIDRVIEEAVKHLKG